MESIHFTGLHEVVILHVERYNKQIERLLAVQDYTEDQIGSVDRFEFHRARERRIKAYNDCINTMIQKEKVLQYHQTGFQLEVVEEKITVTEEPELDFHRLTVDQLRRIVELFDKARLDPNKVVPPAAISPVVEIPVLTPTASPVMEIEEPNINLIQVENRDEVDDLEPLVQLTQKQKLQAALDRLAAEKFKQAGAKLDQQEEQLIKYQSN